MSFQTRRLSAFWKIVILLIFLGSAFVWRGTFLNLLSFIEKPFSAVGTWLHVSGGNERLNQLEEQLRTIVVDKGELVRLREENESLRSQLNFTEQRRKKTVTASILARDTAHGSARFLLDKGFRDGVRPDVPVIVDNGFYVAKITEVQETTSVAEALVQPGILTAATLLNERRTIGLTEGVDGALIKLRFIPLNHEIKEQDIAVSSGLEDKVPAGLFIGKVVRVDKNQDSSFQEALIEPFFDNRRLTIVSIILEEDL